MTGEDPPEIRPDSKRREWVRRTLTSLFMEFQRRRGLRERVREEKHSLGRKLLEAPGYTFRILVTNGPDLLEEIWSDDNRPAERGWADPVGQEQPTDHSRLSR